MFATCCLLSPPYAPSSSRIITQVNLSCMFLSLCDFITVMERWLKHLHPLVGTDAAFPRAGQLELVHGLDVQMGLSFCLSSFFIVRSWSMLYCLPEVTTFICLFSQECLTSMGLWCLKGETGYWLFCSTTNWLDQVLFYAKFPVLDWQRQPIRSLLTFWNICQRSDWDANAWTGTSKIRGSRIETPLGC